MLNPGRQRRRALFIVTSMGVGGIQTYVLNVLRHCDRSKLEIDVCFTGTNAGRLAGEVIDSGSRLIACRYRHTLLPFVLRLARALKAGQYDVVCDFAGDFAAGSLWAGWLAGVPARVAVYRSSRTKYRPTAARRAVARFFHHSILWHATSILSNSHANLASAFAPREMDSRFAVVYNGVDLAAFGRVRAETRSAVRRELDIPESAFVIGHVGSFIPVKAHDVLLEAFGRVAASHAATHLLLVGDGPLLPGTEQLAVRLGLSGRVTFAGVRRDVPRLLQAMDLFVMPSRFEGFPNALIEAEATGLPVVASDRREIREAMPPENHDCLATTDDAASFADRIASLLVDEERRSQKGRVGAEFVERTLPLERSVEEFCARLAPPACAPVGVPPLQVLGE